MSYYILNFTKQSTFNPIKIIVIKFHWNTILIYCKAFIFLLASQIGTALYSQQGLTLKQAWDYTKHNNYTLQQQEVLISKMTEEVSIQRAGYLPTLNALASYNYVSELAQLDIPITVPGINIPSIEAGVNNQYDLTFMVVQPIFLGFRTKNLVSSAKQQLQAQSIQKVVVENTLLLQVGLLYYNIQLNLMQQDVLRESIKRADNQLQLMRNLFEADQITAFDTLEVANRILQLNNTVLKLDNLNQVLVLKLGHILNKENLPEIEQLTTESIDLTLKDLADYQNQAKQQRPELQQISSLHKAQTFGMKATRSAYYPQIYSSFSYHYARPGVNFFKDEWMDYYAAGVNLQWNLWSWKKNQRKVQQMKYEVHRLGLQNQQLIQNIQQQVKEAYQQLKTTLQQIQLQKQLLQQEKERYRITEEKYQQGQISALDVSTAEHALTQAHLEQQKNYINWYQYRLQLDFANGKIGN
ncbi:TolC family protein [candidate division KSB1 bacterium]|nr:TolC family protein [candidate division KSB1 bacterium]